jgi:hypothetical protein
LLFSVEQGQVAERIIRRCIAERRPIPPTFADAPELVFGLEFFLKAFNDLTDERPRGFGHYPIPRSAIVQWCRDEAVDDPDLRDDIIFLVRELDRTWIEYAVQKEKDNTDEPERGLGHGKRSTEVR